MDEDEISFKLVRSTDGKKITLAIESTGEITNADYIMYLETFLSDLCRAEKQIKEIPGQLH